MTKRARRTIVAITRGVRRPLRTEKAIVVDARGRARKAGRFITITQVARAVHALVKAVRPAKAIRRAKAPPKKPKAAPRPPPRKLPPKKPAPPPKKARAPKRVVETAAERRQRVRAERAERQLAIVLKQQEARADRAERELAREKKERVAERAALKKERAAERAAAKQAQHEQRKMLKRRKAEVERAETRAKKAEKETRRIERERARPPAAAALPAAAPPAAAPPAAARPAPPPEEAPPPEAPPEKPPPKPKKGEELTDGDYAILASWDNFTHDQQVINRAALTPAGHHELERREALARAPLVEPVPAKTPDDLLRDLEAAIARKGVKTEIAQEVNNKIVRKVEVEAWKDQYTASMRHPRMIVADEADAARAAKKASYPKRQKGTKYHATIVAITQHPHIEKYSPATLSKANRDLFVIYISAESSPTRKGMQQNIARAIRRALAGLPGGAPLYIAAIEVRTSRPRTP